MMFSFSKSQVHIFNMSATIVKSSELIAKKVWKKLIIQTCHLVLTKFQKKFSNFIKAVILSKVIFPYQNGRCTSSICLQQLCKVSD